MKLIKALLAVQRGKAVILSQETYQVLLSNIGKHNHCFIDPLYPSNPRAFGEHASALAIPRGEEEKFAVAWKAKRNEIIEAQLKIGISREMANRIRTAFLRPQIDSTKR